MAVVSAVVGGVVAIGGAVMQTAAANKQAKDARTAQQQSQDTIDSLVKSRQEIKNPYASSKDLSSMAKDISSMASNPFASLGVATQAAEIQMEQSDMALANTLDTLMSTGASAGGATALAQAALQSKKGIAASIEQQEASNEKLKAQGEQQLNNVKMSEAQRLQSISISEGQRMQSTDAASEQYMLQTSDNRINSDLNRASGQQDQARASEVQANQNKAAAIGGAVSAIGGIAGSLIGASGKSG